MLLAMLWAISLAWFVYSMPNQSASPSTKSEAIVVLTGGQGRVEHGIAMLAQGAAPVLFISGVGEHVTVEQLLLEHADTKTRNQLMHADVDIVLDHVARSTVSNADQTASFLREKNITTIRLVTASYHMKRSMHEFKAVLPDVRILPDAVFPDGFHRESWWQHGNTRRLIFSEFYKYWVVVIRDWLKPTENAAS
jgi:uncharacterized SAM-binding protein YcdF (DUF218 family)